MRKGWGIISWRMLGMCGVLGNSRLESPSTARKREVMMSSQTLCTNLGTAKQVVGVTQGHFTADKEF